MDVWVSVWGGERGVEGVSVSAVSRSLFAGSVDVWNEVTTGHV